MTTRNLLEYANSNATVLDVVGSEDALFVLSLIANNGYMQTAEFKTELDCPPSQVRKTLRRLLKARLAIHQQRSDGIFNGWVTTEPGRELLQSLGLLEAADLSHPDEYKVAEDVANALQTQSRHGNRGPSFQHVMDVVCSVPADRQEWLGFAICFEPIPDDDLSWLLCPNAGRFESLIPTSLDELDKIPTEELKNWATKHGVERSANRPMWSRIQ
jgi:hypothetical protein